MSLNDFCELPYVCSCVCVAAAIGHHGGRAGHAILPSVHHGGTVLFGGPVPHPDGGGGGQDPPSAEIDECSAAVE